MIYGDSVFGEEEEVHVPVLPPAVITTPRNDDDSVPVTCSSDDDSSCSEEERLLTTVLVVDPNGSTNLGNKKVEKRVREESSSSLRLSGTTSPASFPPSKRLLSPPPNHTASQWCVFINEQNDDEMSKVSEINERKITGAPRQPEPQAEHTSKNEQPIIKNSSRKQERNRFDECHGCDICDMHDGYKMLNMQQCKTCRMYIHEKCYSLLQPKQELEQVSVVKYADWECHACSSVGNTITTKKKHHRPKKTVIKQRPFKCALCPVESNLHAMHPLYDKGGVDGQPLIENGEVVWIHTLCAYTITTAFRGGLVYGCDEKGMGEWSSDDEDDEDNNDKLSAEQHQEPEFYNFRHFDSKRKLVFTPDAHHFVIATKLDGATKDCLEDKKEAQQLRCFICGKDSIQTKHIPIQCKNKDCCIACHVGCAKWGHNGAKKHEYVKYCCTEEESEFHCNSHLKLENETLSSKKRKIGEFDSNIMLIIPSFKQENQGSKRGKGSLSDMYYEQRKKSRKNFNSKYDHQEENRKLLTNVVEERVVQTSNSSCASYGEVKPQKKNINEQNLKKRNSAGKEELKKRNSKYNDDAASSNSTDTSRLPRRRHGNDEDHHDDTASRGKRKNHNPKTAVKMTTILVSNQTTTLQNTPKVSKLLNNIISEDSRHSNEDKQKIEECRLEPEVSDRFDYSIMDDEVESETASNKETYTPPMTLSQHVKEETTPYPGIKPNVVVLGQSKSYDGYSPSTSNLLRDYALHGSMKEMITCLRNGSSTQKQDIEETLEIMKQRVEKLTRDQDKNCAPLLGLLHFKRNCLKIFKDAETITKWAMKLWRDRRNIERKYTIKIRSLDSLNLSDEAKRKLEEYDLCIECSGKRTILSNNGNVVSFQNQKNITFERVYLRDSKEQKEIIKLFMVPKKNVKIKPILLGFWQLNLNDVNDQITPKSPQTYSDEGPLKKLTSKFIVDSMKMTLDVSVIDCNEDYFQPKHQQCSELLNKVCSAIKKFQKRPQAQENNEPMVDANIICFGNKMSLLDAAVTIFDLTIIKKLLDLGADVSSKSSSWGTSLNFARHIYKNTRGKGDIRIKKCFQNIIEHLESYKNDQIISILRI